MTRYALLRLEQHNSSLFPKLVLFRLLDFVTDVLNKSIDVNGGTVRTMATVPPFSQQSVSSVYFGTLYAFSM
jgi:hypothetical protein